MFFSEFYKIFKNIFSFDRTPPDGCFLYLLVNFAKFLRTFFVLIEHLRMAASCIYLLTLGSFSEHLFIEHQ